MSVKLRTLISHGFLPLTPIDSSDFPLEIYVKKNVTYGVAGEFVGTYEVGPVPVPEVVPPVSSVENLILESGIVTYVVFRSRIN